MAALLTSFREFFRGGTETGRFVTEHEPSPDLKAYLLKYSSMNDAWARCKRADWMLWLLGETKNTNSLALRKFACVCAKPWKAHIKDNRVSNLLASVEAYVRNETTWDDIISTRSAFYADISSESGAMSELAKTLTWMAGSAAKDDAFTSAYDTCLHSVRVMEILKHDGLQHGQYLSDALRRLFGDPFQA